MYIYNWNLSYTGDATNRLNYLFSLFKKDTICILEEVTPDHYYKLCSIFSDANIEYSLDYRKPGKYDTKQRQLGVCIITSKDIEILNAKCLERCLLPDRTLLVDIKVNSNELRVMGLHSITGCDHKKAKSIQFLSFAEAIDEYKPDIVAFDANEPEADHYDVEQMTFFKGNRDKGMGAKTFFYSLGQHELYDSYVMHYDSIDYVEGEPLAVSHVINGEINRRYDFVFTNRYVVNSKYLYKEAVEVGSDHALIEVEVELWQSMDTVEYQHLNKV